MNATSVVLIAFGLFAEFASIAKTDQYTIKNEYLYTINGHKPTSKWPRRAMMDFVTKVSKLRIIGETYVLSYFNILYMLLLINKQCDFLSWKAFLT